MLLQKQSAFAKARGIFSDTVALLTYQARERTEKTRNDYRKFYIKDQLRSFFMDQEHDQRMLNQKREERAKEVVEVLHQVKQHSITSPQVVYVNFIWLRAYSDIQQLITPYYTKEFEYRWKRVYASFDHLSFDSVFSKLKESFILPKFQRWSYHQFLDLGVVNDLLSFLTEDREGAFVVLALIDVARFGSWKRERHEIDNYGKKFYPNISMSDFPGIADTDPIETLRVIKALNELMQLKQTDDAFTNTFLRYFKIPGYYIWKPSNIEGRFRRFIAKEVFMKEKFLSDLRETGNFPAFRSIGFEFKFDVEEKREKVKLLKTSLQEQWDFFSRNNPAAASYWNHCDDFTRTYLLGRATDLVEYGECVANVSFPQPTFVGAGELVSALVSLLMNVETRLLEAEIRRKSEKMQPLIEKECTDKMTKISFDPPDHFPRVLNDTERDMLKQECLNELSLGMNIGWSVQKTLQVVEEFSRFCRLLSRPENHIYVQSGQYVQRLVPSRTVIDMIHEMGQELVSLPRFTAYAKLIEEHEGEQETVKQKIQTRQLPEPEEVKIGEFIVSNMRYVDTTACTRHRDDIEREIRERQRTWQRREPLSQKRLEDPPERPPPRDA